MFEVKKRSTTREAIKSSFAKRNH